MRYKTPKALEQAVKAAAVKSDRDTSKAIAGFYHDRFLCRTFASKREDTDRHPRRIPYAAIGRRGGTGLGMTGTTSRAISTHTSLERTRTSS